MASLKIVHFFAILFFWLVLVAMLVHLGAFCAFQSGLFDAVLRPAEPRESLVLTAPAASAAKATESKETPAVAKQSESKPAPTAASAFSASAAAAVEARTDLALASDEATSAAANEDQPWWTKERARASLPLVRQLASTMRLVGLLSSVLLLVTLFVYLEISLLGRLAGVRYLTMSFFLMLFFVATVYTWEPLLPGYRIIGSFYVLNDLLAEYTNILVCGKTLALNERIFYYVHFLAMPLFSFLLLIVSWLRFRKGYEESVLLNE